MDTDILIIGGGLAGIALAEALNTAGEDFLLVEARDRFGGRIKCETVMDAAFDVGPAWFWPGQPRMDALVTRLGLTRFEQYSSGDLIFEDQNGVHRGQGFASMEGSYRLDGGLAALIAALGSRIPPERLQNNAPVTRVALHDGRIAVAAGSAALTATRVVLAVPPRIAASFQFEPALPDNAIAAMQDVPTWMAGQAKAVALFDRPFWREAGLSGDASSRVGPMVELHDASPKDGGPYGLFGFIGVPPGARRNEEALRKQVRAQLERLFGPDAADPRDLFVKDWAFDPYTSTEADLAPLYAHPQYRLRKVMSDLWQGRLIFGGTEVAPEFGGFLEGALEAAEIAFARLNTD